MKKNIYISPALQVVLVSTSTIVATSKLDVDSSKSTTTQYTKENQNSWGNIWDDDEE